MSRFSATVIRGKTCRPSGTWQIPSRISSCAGMPSMRSPSKVIEPATGRSMPDTVFCVVVLPAPFAPSSATISPSFDVEADALQRPDAAVADLDVVDVEHQLALGHGSLIGRSSGSSSRTCDAVGVDQVQLGLVSARSASASSADVPR